MKYIEGRCLLTTIILEENGKKSIRYLAELNNQQKKFILMQITYNAKYIKLLY